MPANWKTTLAGLLTLLMPILVQWLSGADTTALNAISIPAGAGLIFARDAGGRP